MIIQGSVFGAMADRNQWGQFSCIKENGRLDKKKFAGYMRIFANDGANCTREIPFLVTDKKWQGQKQRNFLPAKWVDGKYDWEHLNQTYFDNLKEMIKIVNRHNMAFQFSIFDRCHSFNMPDSPWKLNHQGIEGYYDWNQYAQKYVKTIIKTVKIAQQEFEEETGAKCRLLFELENEPNHEGFTKSAIETLKLLLNEGFQKDQVEDGVFYLPQENNRSVIRFHNNELVRSDLFEALKREKKQNNLYPGDDLEDKSRYFSTIHDFASNPEVMEELEEALSHTRRFSISCDGEKPKPSAVEWKERLLPLFKKAAKRPGKTKRIQKWKFEHMYRGDLEGNSMFVDHMHGVAGISEAYKDAFGKWPDNYGKFPEIVPDPNPNPEPVPDPEKTLQQQINELKAEVLKNKREIEELKQRFG